MSVMYPHKADETF